MENRVTFEQVRAIVVEQGWFLRTKKCWGKDYVFATKSNRHTKEQKCLGLLENLEGVLAYARALSDPPLPSSPLGGAQVFFTQRSSWRKALLHLYSDGCMRCGWNLAPCDAHHICPKRMGGTYLIENGVLLCPNCHRLADLGLISPEELRRAREAALSKSENQSASTVPYLGSSLYE